MGFFDAMKVNLFSEMKGVVTLNGKPISGANVIRVATPVDKEYTDQTVTDMEGRFYLNRLETHMFLKLLPSDHSIHQKVTIEYDGKQYLAWKTVVYDRYKGELNPRNVIGTAEEIDIDLKCELTAKNTSKEGIRSSISGLCTWEGHKLLD